MEIWYIMKWRVNYNFSHKRQISLWSIYFSFSSTVVWMKSMIVFLIYRTNVYLIAVNINIDQTVITYTINVDKNDFPSFYKWKRKCITNTLFMSNFKLVLLSLLSIILTCLTILNAIRKGGEQERRCGEIDWVSHGRERRFARKSSGWDKRVNKRVVESDERGGNHESERWVVAKGDGENVFEHGQNRAMHFPARGWDRHLYRPHKRPFVRLDSQACSSLLTPQKKKKTKIFGFSSCWTIICKCFIGWSSFNLVNMQV